jgi:nucleotide-binding universal stress UspA family protein
MTNQQLDTATDGARIVVGVDGSATSIDALRAGVRMATALGIRLEAVTAWHVPDLYGGYRGEIYVPILQDVEDGARAVLDESVTAVFGPTPPPPWFRGVVREGRSASALMEASEDAEMLVVGSRGHGGFAGLLMGSVSAACAEHASCPVLVVHADETIAA